MDQRHRTRNPVKSREREHDGAGHKLSEQHRFGEIECLMDREVTGHAVVNAKSEESEQCEARGGQAIVGNGVPIISSRDETRISYGQSDKRRNKRPE